MPCSAEYALPPSHWRRSSCRGRQRKQLNSKRIFGELSQYSKSETHTITIADVPCSLDSHWLLRRHRPLSWLYRPTSEEQFGWLEEVDEKNTRVRSYVAPEQRLRVWCVVLPWSNGNSCSDRSAQDIEGNPSNDHMRQCVALTRCRNQHFGRLRDGCRTTRTP